MTAPVALVTGANRGIGMEVARQLAGRGHQVAICARNAADAEAAALAIGAGTAGFVLDITDPVSVDAAVAAVVAHFGRLDVVVNNAGGHYDDGATISRVTDEDLRDALEINTFGALRVTRAAIPHLRASGHGRVVNVSSRSGTFSATWGDAPAYAVSKAALNMVTLLLAKELAGEQDGDGILVNACCPGWVRTRMGGDDAERSVEEGADTPVWLATLPDDGPTGGLFGERQPIAW
ncbi:MAG: SDR family NAD(P)-dependent oxidoreductase [Ilumatobacteraceae bacterium]|nr:SDR family NAD(P)-dependent oxidoreductase [Ilumatobacteraceae bacterium]